MLKGTLVLIRHGESQFNALNLFTGWLDVGLTENGIQEAHKASLHCRQFNYDAVFTSHLARAHETLLIILSNQKKIGIFRHQSDSRYNTSKKIPNQVNKKTIPVYLDKALNERAYGVLQGMDKNEAVKLYGGKQMLKWRRGFSDRPPGGESLKDVYQRAIPYIQEMVLPGLKRGKTNLIVGHGNTLRATIKFLEGIEDDKISSINLPFGRPLVYEYKNNNFKRIEGEYNFERTL